MQKIQERGTRSQTGKITRSPALAARYDPPNRRTHTRGLNPHHGEILICSPTVNSAPDSPSHTPFLSRSASSLGRFENPSHRSLSASSSLSSFSSPPPRRLLLVAGSARRVSKKTSAPERRHRSCPCPCASGRRGQMFHKARRDGRLFASDHVCAPPTRREEGTEIPEGPRLLLGGGWLPNHLHHRAHARLARGQGYSELEAAAARPGGCLGEARRPVTAMGGGAEAQCFQGRSPQLGGGRAAPRVTGAGARRRAPVVTVRDHGVKLAGALEEAGLFDESHVLL